MPSPPMARLILFNKPYGVITQFSPSGGKATLKHFIPLPGFYPAGRLDTDSEGLLLLSDEPELNERLLHPRHGHKRIYWAQVERVPETAALAKLASGPMVQGRKALPCRAWLLDPQPEVPPRDPPIRFRKKVATAWIGLELTEGKNRQVRRMTAAIGHPTLRLIRVQIGMYTLPGDLGPGTWKELSVTERALVRGS